jgi:hypothetical protein
MIKLRTKENKIFKVKEDVGFVEICDNDGNLGALIHIQDSQRLSLCIPGDPTFENYLIRYKVTPSKFYKHNITDNLK